MDWIVLDGDISDLLKAVDPLGHLAQDVPDNDGLVTPPPEPPGFAYTSQSGLVGQVEQLGNDL